jgi:hypothetical protein
MEFCKNVGVRWGVYASWLFFFASLFFPAFYLSHDGTEPYEEYPAIGLLLIGWMGLGKSLTSVGWLANPLLLLTNILLNQKSYGRAALCSAAAVALGFSVLLKRTAVRDGSGFEWIISGYGEGFFLWQTALGLMFVTAMTASILAKRKR